MPNWKVWEEMFQGNQKLLSKVYVFSKKKTLNEIEISLDVYFFKKKLFHQNKKLQKLNPRISNEAARTWG